MNVGDKFVIISLGLNTMACLSYLVQGQGWKGLYFAGASAITFALLRMQ